MGVDVHIPNKFDVDLDVVGPVDLEVIKPVEIAGIPTTYHINLDHIPKITLGIDPLHIEPLDVSVKIKEFPSIRGHVPANFTVGLSVLGVPLVCVRLCGEAQVITEPYVPNPCERCGAVPTTVGVPTGTTVGQPG